MKAGVTIWYYRIKVSLTVNKYGQQRQNVMEVACMKKLNYLLIAIAILLSDIMCAVVAFNYRDMICGIEHSSYSAPASVAFLSAISFSIGIIVCAAVAYMLHKKAR